MITVKFDDKGMFFRQMNNLVKYSAGFIDGVNKGKRLFFQTVGDGVKEILGSFIDVNARVNPEALRHVYEWYRTGSPDARLFDITYTVSNIGLSVNSTFTQSSSVSKGSTEPFREKARLMESGASITISPRNRQYLKFDINGEEIYTPNPVTIENVGGAQTTGAFSNIFDLFFTTYFSQSFLQSAGVRNKLSNPVIYKKSLPAGLRSGSGPGVAAGYKWITSIGAEAL